MERPWPPYSNRCVSVWNFWMSQHHHFAKSKIRKMSRQCSVSNMKVPLFIIQMLLFYASLRILYILRIDVCTSPETKTHQLRGISGIHRFIARSRRRRTRRGRTRCVGWLISFLGWHICQMYTPWKITLQGIHISHLGKFGKSSTQNAIFGGIC